MKKTITFYDFKDGFDKIRPNYFSLDGLVSLFEYFEQYEDDCGEEIEFDVIALCCEFTEYEDIEDFHKCYDKEEYPDFDTIREHTQLIEIEDIKGFIIQDF